jgi:hypothetical protein
MALIGELGARRAAEGRRRRRDVMSNLGLERFLWGQGIALATHAGRRSLCGRGDA